MHGPRHSHEGPFSPQEPRESCTVEVNPSADWYGKIKRGDVRGWSGEGFQWVTGRIRDVRSESAMCAWRQKPDSVRRCRDVADWDV